MMVMSDTNGDFLMPSDLPQFQTMAKNLLKAELKRRGVGYQHLVDRLAEVGVQETERNIANKLSRGRFSAAFFLQCLSVIGCKTIRLEE